MYNFPNRLKQLRTEKELSQKELGKMVSVDKSTICLYESGGRQPNFKVMEKLADYFDVSLDYLIGRTYGPDKTAAGKSTWDIEELFNTAKIMYQGKQIPAEVKQEILEYIEFLIHKRRTRE